MSWSKDIDFHCTFGVWPFKKSLDITPAGFQYCGELFPMKEITRVRWGVDQRRGGIFPKLVYCCTFGTNVKEVTIKTKERDFYEQLTEHVWRAVGSRLLAQMVSDLHHGKTIDFREFTVDDCGITLRKTKTHLNWSELKWGIVNGNIVFTKCEVPDRPVASASFLHTDNTHILSVALAIFQNIPDKRSLSNAVANNNA